MSRAFLTVLLVSIALAVAACAIGKAEEPAPSPTPVVTPTSEPTLTPESTPTQNPTATPEPTATLVVTPEPTATPTPEPTPVVEPPSANPVPGSCLVLEEKYCRQVTLIEWQGMHFGVVNLPPEVRIFSPFDGKLGLGGRSLINPDANVAGVRNSSNPHAQVDDVVFTLTGDFLITIESKLTQIPVSTGDIIARSSDRGITVFDEYTLTFSFIRFDPEQKKWVEDGLFEKLFPAAGQ